MLHHDWTDGVAEEIESETEVLTFQILGSELSGIADCLSASLACGIHQVTFRVDASEETVEEITNVGEGFGKYDVLNKELSRSVTVGPPVGRTVNRAPVIVNPTLATYRRGKLGPFLSPFFPLGTKESGSNLQGRTWEMIWENVDFPLAGTPINM